MPARPYQEDAVAAYFAYAGQRGRMFVMATGTGKTFTGHLVVKRYLDAGHRVLWLADRGRLVEQPYKALDENFPELKPYAGVVMQRQNGCDKQLVYASKDTLRQPRRLAEYMAHGMPKLVVVDEAHHSVSNTWGKLLLVFDGADLLGLTATPAREDNRRLSEKWEIVFSYDILRGLSEKALIPPVAALDLIPGFDASEIAMDGGDYDEGELGRELLKAHIVEHTVEAMGKEHEGEMLPFRDAQESFLARGKQCLVFTATVEQAELTADALRVDGWRARAVHGQMSPAEQKRLIDLFEDGQLDCLCNAILLTEGVDMPCAQVAVFARPTRSWSLYVQMVGRVLRPYADQQHAYVIDLCGPTAEHSIVAAPVLVEGTDCDESPDGSHRYLAIEGTGEGRCQHCGELIKCFKLGSGHKYKNKRCVGCGTIQCPSSPDEGHHWIPWDDGKRVCIHCAVEIPDPLAAMVDRTVREQEPVAWKKLKVPGSVYACDLGRVGIMFNFLVKSSDDGGRWMPILVTGGVVKPLAPSAVSGQMARLLTDDVARRVGKVKGFRGGKDSEAAMRFAMIRAEQLFKTKVAA